ncbi:outer membrane beta-barrel protein [Snuella sedimenti]|uniref:Cell envelope biogenesis protein OmpA n=1 Tax=Snuella sedimenti TaxID=2798802 RepID=A0A8J7ITK7_9FLAO|nr:outer membrane beta-barrel protein [Snuella sedimenti]MBJ6367745.1 cell envelope biogenesis protein OmpA [Snuella sedimenti]
MTSNLKRYTTLFFLAFIICAFQGMSQGDPSTFKGQIALGINNPSQSGFVGDFEAKSLNFPSINLGIQYMFGPLLGAKADFGYNRFSNLDNTPEFKVNYTRFNAQLVCNATRVLGFVPRRIGVFAHAGPGFSMIKPLGDYGQNDTSFLNAMGGLEFHFGVSDALSVYLDTSYILGFSDDFDPVTEGYGSFNGNMLTFTIGFSISLSGCYYCENE